MGGSDAYCAHSGKHVDGPSIRCIILDAAINSVGITDFPQGSDGEGIAVCTQAYHSAKIGALVYVSVLYVTDPVVQAVVDGQGGGVNAAHIFAALQNVFDISAA
ncbi:hypothetical protein [Saccharospirillum impatiens]|uniref:hypothetical protein n=1 Tax=Saccharospirillum impatiens TaxID=169438 RepID=UPI0003FFE04B|nr:hypothetical protein [Saccharospirillum impatiens]